VLDVAGVKARGASGQVLTAAKVDAINTFAAPDVVAPKPIVAVRRGDRLVLTVPAKAVAVVGLEI
jgi:alpha-N-arabinofuranosidase